MQNHSTLLNLIANAEDFNYKTVAGRALLTATLFTCVGQHNNISNN